MKAPTPPFFRKLRNIGLAIAAIAATLLSTPVALPALVLKIAAYMAVAGTVASTVSQATTVTDTEPPGGGEDTSGH